MTKNHLFEERKESLPFQELYAEVISDIELVRNITINKELSEEYLSLRLSLETKVERSFYEAGKALKELRDKKLYLHTHSTFEEYCRDRFGFGRDSAYLKINAARIFENLSKNLPTIGRQILLPAKERQLRPLVKAKLPSKTQVLIWQQAVEEALGKQPSSRLVQTVLERCMDSTSVNNFYRQNEVCKLIPNNEPNLKGKGGYWGIITQVNEVNCSVQTWEGEYQVPIKYLQSLALNQSQSQQVKNLLQRLSLLTKVESLDKSVYLFCISLGKQPLISEIEEKILENLEKYYLHQHN